MWQLPKSLLSFIIIVVMVGGSNGNFNYCIVSLLNVDQFCYLEFIIDRASSSLGCLLILHGRANSLDNQIVPVHFIKNGKFSTGVYIKCVTIFCGYTSTYTFIAW